MYRWAPPTSFLCPSSLEKQAGFKGFSSVQNMIPTILIAANYMFNALFPLHKRCYITNLLSVQILFCLVTKISYCLNPQISIYFCSWNKYFLKSNKFVSTESERKSIRGLVEIGQCKQVGNSHLLQRRRIWSVYGELLEII